MGANISKCGKYRYLLWREFNDIFADDKVMTFIMLNPSTADADTDDPTIRRCIAFAKRHKCNYLQVINLFAFRATDPKELKYCEDPVGPDNKEAFRDAIINCHNPDYKGIFVCAWGNHGTYMRQDETALGWLEEYGIPVYCLGLSKDGNPKHPLYLKADSELIIYEKQKRE